MSIFFTASGIKCISTATLSSQSSFSCKFRIIVLTVFLYFSIETKVWPFIYKVWPRIDEFGCIFDIAVLSRATLGVNIFRRYWEIANAVFSVYFDPKFPIYFICRIVSASVI